MGNFYFNKWVLIPLFLLVASMAASAQDAADRTVKQTRTITYYGDWYGATGVPAGTPTKYKNFFYDKNNRLVGNVELEPLFGDNETTEEIEVAGDMLPLTYTSYSYDERGNLSSVRQRNYKVHDGLYRTWTDYSETESYAYDTNGRLTEKVALGKRNAYTWEGENMVADTAYSATGAWQSTTRYSNFMESEPNKPQSVLKMDKYPSNQRIGEYVYGQDSKGMLRPVSYTEYELANIVEDGKGGIASADKGAAYMKEEWIYDGDRLTTHLTSYYDKSQEAFVPNKKTVYTIVDEGEKVENYSYAPSIETWAGYGTPSIYTYADYTGSNVPENLTVTQPDSKKGSVLLSCDVPASALAGATWKVYRNGVQIGTASVSNGKISYEENDLRNGKYTYFIQCSTEAQPEGNITTPVEITLEVALSTVENIRTTNQGVVTEGSLTSINTYNVALVEWDAPVTDLQVLGYNVYTDIKYYQSNPTPDNGATLITTQAYELKWPQASGNSHSIYVEAVYAQGKARSKAHAYVISGTGKKAIKTIYTLGDAMGSAGDNAISKIQSYYYDSNNRLVSIINNSFLLGDDPDTPEVEHAGDIVPYEFTLYDYNEAGQLTTVRKRTFGVYSGYEKAWEDFSELESYEYDANGKVSKKTEVGRWYEYAWEGNNMVKESQYSASSGNQLYSFTYSDFVEGVDNLPRRAVKDGLYTSNQRIFEYTYDENNNLVYCQVFKYGEKEVDDAGNIISLEKGTPDYEEKWTYENGELALYEKNTWKTASNSYQPYFKTVYTKTDLGMREDSQSYSVGIWTKSGTPKITATVDHYPETAVSNAKLTETAPSTVKITGTVPAMTFGTPVYNVYRNGVKVGEATAYGNAITFTESQITNGTWHYFMQAATESDNIGINISDMLEYTSEVQLDAVQGIKVLENGTTESGDYRLKVAWNTPKSSWPIKGYNIYTNIKASTKNPAPDNGTELISDTTYTFTWHSDTDLNKTVYVETVYNVGKAMSDGVSIQLNTMSLEEQNSYVEMTKSLYTMGDILGGASDYTPSKVERYYYDENNRLSRKVLCSYLSGDDPNTPEVEQAGDIVPYTYFTYNYNEAGQLEKVQSRIYGVYSGWDKVWLDPVDVEVYEYDTNGKVCKKTESGRWYEYVWEGNNLVKESQYSASSGNQLYSFTYSDFVEGVDNLPRRAVKDGLYTSNQRIFEYTYDENNNLVYCQVFKYGEKEVDDAGNIISLEKGTPDYEEKWTYENGELALYEKNTWKTASNSYQPSNKTEYTQVELGTLARSSSCFSGIWTQSGLPQITEKARYYKGTAPVNLTATLDGEKANTVSITFEAPANALGTTWNVFRNGSVIGTATLTGNGYRFDDENVPNGQWEYFVQSTSDKENADANISNAVTNVIATELVPVTSIRVVENGVMDNGHHSVKIEWDAPETDMPVKGYNIYSDVKETTKNPAPDNGTDLLTERNFAYENSAEPNTKKVYYIETVYNIGKVKSAPFEVVMSSDPVGIDNCEISVQGSLIIADNNVIVNGDYEYLDIYATNGISVGRFRNTSSINTSSLSAGVYVAKLTTSTGIQTVKFVKK